MSKQNRHPKRKGSTDRPRIMIVEDHPLMQKGMAMTLEAELDYEISGMFASSEEAIEHAREEQPDLAIVDISLPGMSGLDLIKHLRHYNSGMKMLVVSRHDEELYAERVIRAGAHGYIMKVHAGERVVNAVRKILGGGIFLSDKMSSKLLMGISSGSDQPALSPYERLSNRELEVFRMIGKGKSTREIAERMFISPKTVDSYKARIKEKLHISNSSELLQQAVQWEKEERV